MAIADIPAGDGGGASIPDYFTLILTLVLIDS